MEGFVFASFNNIRNVGLQVVKKKKKEGLQIQKLAPYTVTLYVYK